MVCPLARTHFFVIVPYRESLPPWGEAIQAVHFRKTSAAQNDRLFGGRFFL